MCTDRVSPDNCYSRIGSKSTHYYCSSGNLTDKAIKAYIGSHSHEEDVGFGVEGAAAPSA